MRAFAKILALAAAGAFALGGCSGLMPRAQNEVVGPWHSFDEAKNAIDGIAPYRTTAADLRARGIDPLEGPNVQLLTYSDIVLRFPVTSSIPQERLDRGLRECLEAGKTCTGYALAASNLKHDRVGDFWLDALNFKRVTETSGWSFNALVLLVDNRVVYTLYGGQPKVHQIDTVKQPLGPVQGWGDALPQLAR